MKFTYLYIVLTLIFISCSTDDDSAVVVGGVVDTISTIGGTDNESAQTVISTSDGGYAILGYTQSMDGDVEGKTNNSFDYWLLKYSSSGSLEWQKTYGGTAEDRGYGLVQTLDGGYALFGYSKSTDGDASENAGGRDFWVIKVDNIGSVIWQKSHGFIGSDYGTKMISTLDNGLLLVGVIDVTSSAGLGNDRAVQHAGGDYWAIKLDANGNKLWRHYYGGNLADTPNAVIETSDGGFILVGTADSTDVDITNNKGSYDIWVVKISNTGTILWEKSFGGAEIDSGFAIINTSDGNFLITGDTRSSDQDITTNNGAADVWILKMSPTGNLLWQKTIGGSSFDVGRAICRAQEGGFFIAGSSRSEDGDMTINQGQNDGLIMKISNDGTLEWQKTIGGSNIDFFYGITQLSNGNVIAVGDSMSEDGDITINKGFTDVLITTIK